MDGNNLPGCRVGARCAMLHKIKAIIYQGGHACQIEQQANATGNFQTIGHNLCSLVQPYQHPYTIDVDEVLTLDQRAACAHMPLRRTACYWGNPLLHLRH